MVTLPRTKVCGRKTLLSERDLTLRQKEKSKAFGLFFHRPPPQEKERNNQTITHSSQHHTIINHNCIIRNHTAQGGNSGCRLAREMIQEDQGQCSSQAINNYHQAYQDQLLLQQQMQQQNNDIFGGGGRGGLNMYPGEVSQIMHQPWSMPHNQVHHPFNTVREHDPFLVPPQPSPYATLFNRRGHSLQFAYDGSSSDHLRIISDTLGPVVQPGSAPFGLQTELAKMTAQEIMEAKALAASKSHSEAERRRRERINNHLAKLRSLLPSTTKTDKASLLAEVIQHVKELKRQTSLIAESSPVPTEADELTVVDEADEDGRSVIKASLCCEDRSDLFPELIRTLKALRLRTLKAEITTLGGRVKNVLFITGEEEDSSSGSEDHNHQQQYCINSIQEALKAVMEKSVGEESASANIKRQRTNIISMS